MGDYPNPRRHNEFSLAGIGSGRLIVKTLGLVGLVLLTLLIHHPGVRFQWLANWPWLEVFRGLLLCLWIALVLWSGWRLTRPVPLRPRLLTGAVLMLLLAGILIPPEMRQWLEAWLSSLLPSGPKLDSGWDVDVLGHFSLFALLAMLLFWTRADLAWWRLFGLLAALAGASELMQLFIDGRQPDWHDVGVDLAGAGIGALLVGAIRRLTPFLLARQTDQ